MFSSKPVSRPATPKSRLQRPPQQKGVGLYQVTQRNGARLLLGVAYLSRARESPNLHVHTGALVNRITRGTPSSRRRANGVVYAAHGKAFHQVATREVILSGAWRSIRRIC